MRRSQLKNHIFKEASFMEIYPNIVKSKLNTLIAGMSANPAPYVKQPGIDFTRERKLPFEAVMQTLISMGGNSIYKELLSSRGYDPNTATTSAFVQARDKLLPSALEHLLHEFTRSYSKTRTYRGYRLLACDGSDLNIPTNPDDTDTYYPGVNDGKGYNLLHLNALYDLCNRLYVDTVIQPSMKENEKRALTDMVDRSIIDEKAIIIADRSYESYNIFAHIEQREWNYLIRVKDIDSNGILSGLKLPAEEEFDVVTHRILTRRQTNHIKANPDIYRFMPHNATFDFLPLRSSDVCPISFRVVRMKISEGCFQTVITNLDRENFPPGEIKELYRKRWGIETSFRDLKYAAGLVNLHSKKREYIVQEVYARIIMYNFAEMITSHVIISKHDTKHAYKVNFSVALHVCKSFLRSLDNIPPPDVEAIIRKNILPVRPGRSAKRIFRPNAIVSFIYRVAYFC
jgi:hypothetical protein